MRNPQTLAMELYNHFPSKKLKAIKDFGCCAFVLLWCLHIEPENDVDAILILDDLIHKKAIKADCTVKWADAIKRLSGRTMESIKFEDITIISNIKERTPVRFDYNGESHWVGVENGKVAFNPLIFSNCVTYGKPATKRVFKLKGVKE